MKSANPQKLCAIGAKYRHDRRKTRGDSGHPLYYVNPKEFLSAAGVFSSQVVGVVRDISVPLASP
jgi:hypothetical protein